MHEYIYCGCSVVAETWKITNIYCCVTEILYKQRYKVTAIMYRQRYIKRDIDTERKVDSDRCADVGEDDTRKGTMTLMKMGKSRHTVKQRLDWRLH